MHVETVDVYNVHTRYDGVVDCLSDGFGVISISREVGIPILLNKIRCGHYVVMTIVDDEVVSTATGFVEHKLIHAGVEKYKAKNTGSRVMHIEDTATRTDKRGKGYGVEAVKFLQQIAAEEECYKVILDCSVGNYENFYGKLGYKKTELCVRKNV
jgi:GNAT superfamily N-acetyltransferase